MFVSDMFDQLRDLLNDAADTQVPFATKKLYLNRGIARLWPTVYRIAEESQATTEDQYEYDMLKADYAYVMILSVEYSPDGDNENFTRITDYDVVPGDEDSDGYLRLAFNPSSDGLLRIRIVLPISQIAAASYAAAGSETWIGPDRLIGLPVLYAMGMIAARRLDDRQDHTRYSTVNATNGVTDQDIMVSAQMWFGQFESELLAAEKPLPIARD